ncbi:hypothetical protein CD351_11065 [Erythrobacter sp. KY5]|uniref:YciI family protein n=1 Tax=Erythrobacter sp. KY5 TaxID=2011159 RepID=UPI000DBF37CE|nr:YciI family protein [Erythrobacter sp. KY5]AWW74966.1 hypothetical protein CD351_11065 [Erythrobacter sp. KY5]
MQFMLLINEDESIYDGDEGAKRMEETLAGHMALAKAWAEKGVAFSGERLKLGSTATTIRWDAGTHTLHDGPFAETHEELGGFYIIDVASLDDALDWARQIPVPGKGAVEVRPIWPMEG